VPYTPENSGLPELLLAYQRAIDVNIISSITDAQGTIIHANQKFCEVSKYSKEELIGQNHRIINSNHHSKAFFQDMWNTISQGNVWHGEIKNMARDHSYYWVETVIIPIRNAQEEIAQYLSLRLLITDRKETEGERQEYTKKLKTLVGLVSHQVRGPLASCLGLMNLLEKEPDMPSEQQQEVFFHLKQSAMQLEKFTRQLSGYITALEAEYSGVSAGSEDEDSSR
jgi:PAS domain S-box-containing protein